MSGYVIELYRDGDVIYLPSKHAKSLKILNTIIVDAHITRLKLMCWEAREAEKWSLSASGPINKDDIVPEIYSGAWLS